MKLQKILILLSTILPLFLYTPDGNTSDYRIVKISNKHFDNLLLLPKAEEDQKSSTSFKTDQLIKDVIAQFNGIRSYSSIRSIISYYTGDPEEIMHHRMDFTSPDRFFITQTASDSSLGILYDQWVNIGRVRYQNAGLWSKSQDDRNKDINQSLKVDYIYEIIGNNRPHAYSSLLYRNKEYVYLVFNTPLSGTYSPFYTNLFHIPVDSPMKSSIHIWFDTGKLEIKKVEIDFYENEILQFIINQIFSCYNSGFVVIPPPWVNLKTDEDDSKTVYGDTAPILEHNDCKEGTN